MQGYTWHGARLGLTAVPTALPFEEAVVQVAPKSTAAEAGITVGDVLHLRDLSPAGRYRFGTAMLAGHRYSFTVFDSGGKRARRFTYVPTCCAGFDWSSWSWFAGALGAVIFATLLAWRRPRLPEARILCALLAVSVLTTCLASNNWVTPVADVDMGAALAAFALEIGWFALLVSYTLLFGRPVSMVRRIISIAAFGIAGLFLLYDWCGAIGYWTGAFDLSVSGFYAFGTALGVVIDGLPLVCIMLAVIAARGRERSLLVWTTAMIFLGGLAQVASDVIFAYVPALTGNTTLGDAIRYISNGSVFLTPFAIGYALLNRRLMDIGFALNRAIVFSAVSLITVAVFVLVEWALSEWLSSKDHSTNVLVAAGLALVLGLSMRYIHRYVDDAVDRALFFKRRRDQEALNAFSREAAYITDRDLLLERTHEVLGEHADASAASVLLDDRSGKYGDVSENDPAIVSLRASHDVLDLHTVHGDIHGDYAFPMVSRGRVLGVLVLGPKRSGESYAPDERELILRLAHSVASAIDVLAHESVPDPTLAKLDAVYSAHLVAGGHPRCQPRTHRGPHPYAMI